MIMDLGIGCSSESCRSSAVESHICKNRADTRISCTRSQKVPRVRLSLRKAAWSSSKPTSCTGNTRYGAPVIGYGTGREKLRLEQPGNVASQYVGEGANIILQAIVL